MSKFYRELWSRFLRGRIEFDDSLDPAATGNQENLPLHRTLWANLFLVTLAFAFLAVLLLLVSGLRLGKKVDFGRVSRVRPVGIVTELKNVRWMSKSVGHPRVGENVLPGMMALQDGLLSKRLESGVDLTLDGQTEIELIDEDHADLRNGRLWIDAPSRQIAFEIKLADCKLSLKNARVRIDADGNSATVEVFRGDVQVMNARDDQQVMSLSTGTYRLAADEILPVDHAESESFREQSLAGVAATTGAVRLLSSNPRELTTLTDDFILVYPETNNGVVVTDELAGLSTGLTSDAPLVSGNQIHSYRVAFDGTAEHSLKGRGTIRFEQPIFAVLADDASWNAMDECLGQGDITTTGMAGGPAAMGWSISPDRKTLLIDWSREIGLQQVRVLFEQASVLAPLDPESILPERVARFTQSYCRNCHEGPDASGYLDLQSLAIDLNDRKAFGYWVRIHDRVRDGQMPPAGEIGPAEDERRDFLAALSSALLTADLDFRAANGRAEVRRLNRFEYENALRDHLALPDLRVRDILPPDGIVHGFDKSAEALEFSHVQVARLMDAADHGLMQAMAAARTPIPAETIRFDVSGVDTESLRPNLLAFHSLLRLGYAVPMVGTEVDRTIEVDRGNHPLGDFGYVKDTAPHFDGVAILVNSAGNQFFRISPFTVKSSGLYKLRVSGFGMKTKAGDVVPSDQVETVAFYANGSRLLGRCDLPPNQPDVGEMTVWLDAADEVFVLPTSTPNKRFVFPPKEPFVWHHIDTRGVCMQWFELEGPLEEELPESHRRLFAELPLRPKWNIMPSDTHVDGRSYTVFAGDVDDVEVLLERFARQVLGRQPMSSDLALAQQIAEVKISQGEDFVQAMLSAYRAILCSPSFLLLGPFHHELDNHDLANRLAYFLWCSPPDQELLRLAGRGELTEPSVLGDQVERLLGAPRAERFVEHFLYHWLDLKRMDFTEPDENLYPEYNPLLRESMVEETHAYFMELVREDLGIRCLVDSDFAMVNQSLAQVYGLEGVSGSAIRKVPLPANSVRGGFLTQASILKLTANGTTTSPVMRGAYVLTKFLGDPPPPPPESVAAVEPDLQMTMTVREQLSAHREQTECARCHDKMDPLGFALECFDVMGQYRTHYRAAISAGQKGVPQIFNGRPAPFRVGPAVDATGVMPNGEAFEDMDEFRSQLFKMDRQMAQNLLEQFIVYATGAPPSFADRQFVEDALDRLEPNGFRIKSMIHEVVASSIFRTK